ncbi:hypothetical protein H5410_055505 [Solanum commersonii]|uniref:Uncharacterized protein n=1 Tax=Solanum commersonii TaxID=4109 RepID=A0A9J5WHR7_SOLCO|nr:hypothetical protein H5410_055505 [Solanum commersonii]
MKFVLSQQLQTESCGNSARMGHSQSKVQIRVKACLTQEVLQKKGRKLVPKCFLCNIIGKTNKHLFYIARSPLSYGTFSSTLQALAG